MSTLKLKWSEPKPPMRDISHYDHCDVETPLGNFRIEWKSWKEDPSYEVLHNDIYWGGTEYSLEDAKELVNQYHIKKFNELKSYIELCQQ